MATSDLLQDLAAENNRLRKEMDELEFLIEMKEEELGELKSVAKEWAVLHSKMDENKVELELLKMKMLEEQQKTAGAHKRERALEEEIIYGIETEKSYYELREQYQSSLNTIEIQQEELKITPALMKELNSLRNKLAEAMSELELLQLDNQYLREDLQAMQSNQPDFLTEDDSN